MATDKTEPPTLRIIGIGLGCIATLVGLQFAFTSYFQQMYGEQATTNQATTLRRDQRLYGSLVTRVEGHDRAVAQAMESFAGAGGQRPTAIATEASTDTAALAGWALMPRVVPTPPPPPPAPVPEAAPVAPDANAAPRRRCARGSGSCGGPCARGACGSSTRCADGGSRGPCARACPGGCGSARPFTRGARSPLTAP
jgi:hypothetical protein